MADGHNEEARRLYQEAVNFDQDAQYLDGLGRVCEKIANATGDTARRDEALSAYNQASEKDPKMLNPRLGRGRLHLQRLEHAKALAACQEALALAPADPTIPHCIGISYAALKNKPEAINWLNRAVKIKPMADAYYELGEIYFDMDNRRAAASAFERATALGTKEERDTGVTVPWLTQALYRLGRVYEVEGNRAGSCRAWMEFLRRNPTDRVQANEVRTLTYGCRG
jgi:uncharacterized protein HemY